MLPIAATASRTTLLLCLRVGLGVGDDFARVFRALGGLADGGGDLLERRGGFLEARRLLFGSMREVLRGDGDLLAARSDRVRAFADRLHRLLQLRDGRVEVGLQLAEGFGHVGRDAVAQPLVGEILEPVRDRLDGGDGGFVGDALGRLGPAALGLQRLQIDRDRQVHVHEHGLGEGAERSADFLALASAAARHHALGPGLGDDRLEQVFENDGVAADVPLRFEPDARVGEADRSHVVGEDPVELGGADRVPMPGLRALGASDMGLVAEEAPDLGGRAQLIVEEIERLRHFAVDNGLQAADAILGAGVHFHELHPTVQIDGAFMGGRLFGMSGHGQRLVRVSGQARKSGLDLLRRSRASHFPAARWPATWRRPGRRRRKVGGSTASRASSRSAPWKRPIYIRHNLKLYWLH